MTAPSVVQNLVERFRIHADDYKSGKYNEAQLRQEFLDPFFGALGWDVENSRGLSEAYKEVIHEDSIKIEGKTKAPDYCFRTDGHKSFFVEAKKPSINIKDSTSPAYQLRRYAWSAKLPLGILTDFEEFAIYDCRFKPSKNDQASKARISYFSFEKYAEQWSEIKDRFSKDAVSAGSIEDFAGQTMPRGANAVDDVFLEELEGWRELLAKNLATKNPSLSRVQLSYSVQAILDRIIFLRISEDRGVESYARLQMVLNADSVYSTLVEQFKAADEKYNSGLFHFTSEPGRPDDSIDELTPNLDVDNSVLTKIVSSIYYPESPFEFSVLEPDILGQIYERFLGKVIKLSPSHKATIEVKPEVRKAGGVFYTPTDVVDFITAQTVGNALQKIKLGSRAKGSRLRIVDPACGSGSFLLQVYQYLIDWHLDGYVSDAEKWSSGKSRRIFKTKNGDWRLTLDERKRILLDYIFGVDIDSQAVEVTKLSLLLKALEGENVESLTEQLSLLPQRLLPYLADNIKCGNTLLSHVDFAGHGMNLLDDEFLQTFNPFDWKDEFPTIFADGGFDVVLGNPPYVDVKILGDEMKSLLSSRYESATRRFDLYLPFVERGLELLKDNGELGFIMPSMFMRRAYGKDLRGVIGDKSRCKMIVDFGSNQVFSKAMNYVGVFILAKNKKTKGTQIVRFDKYNLERSEVSRALLGKPVAGVSLFDMPSKKFTGKSQWYLLKDEEASLIAFLRKGFPKLGSIIRHASEGIHSGKDGVFFIEREKAASLKLESPPLQALAKGKDVHRYDAIEASSLPNTVIYPYDLATGSVLNEYQLQQQSPEIWKYLESRRADLAGRAYFDNSSKKWYELWCQRTPELYTLPKIVGPEIAARGEFTISNDPLFINNKLKALVFQSSLKEDLAYILGLLNSSLIVFFHRAIAPPKGGGFFEVKTEFIMQLPIKLIDFENDAEKSLHDTMVKLANSLIASYKKLDTTQDPQSHKATKRQIKGFEDRIDDIVFQLYGVSNEQKKLVVQSLNWTPNRRI